MGVFDFARIAGDGSGKECVHEFAAGEKRVPALAFVLWRYGPLSICNCEDKRVTEQMEGWSTEWWAIDWRQHGCVQAVIESCLHSDLDGAELAALGGWIDGNESAVLIGDGFEILSICAGDYDDGFCEWLESEDGCGD